MNTASRAVNLLGHLGKTRPHVRHHTSPAFENLQVEIFPALGDNYGFLLHDPISQNTAAIDTPECQPILKALERRGWMLTHILNTHWHPDHTGANLELKKLFDLKIIGPDLERAKIPGIDQGVAHGDSIPFGSHSASVIDTGGHTLGHIAYYFESMALAFVGDSLFPLGCGRIFEGTPEQSWSSLQRLMALSSSTVIYSAHEYTLANAQFALSVDPHNNELIERFKEIKDLREKGIATVPTTLAKEKRTNPFLRPHTKEIRQALGMEGNSDLEVWTEIRRRKDDFRG